MIKSKWHVINWIYKIKWDVMVKWEKSYCMERGDTKLEMINTDLSIWHWNTDITQQMKRVMWAKAKDGREANTIWCIQRHKFNMSSDFQKSFAFKSFERKSLRECMQTKPKCGKLWATMIYYKNLIQSQRTEEHWAIWWQIIISFTGFWSKSFLKIFS